VLHSSENAVTLDSVEKENHHNSATPSGVGPLSSRTKKISFSSPTAGDGDDGDVSDIDRRLSDLQKFLEKAR
jgi:hypothetical protein